jgi:glycosyltransferase involved in cell wall biosynthesis
MPRTDAPLVSVIIPVWNGERHLAQAIRSALAQDWSPLEVIVVDDGSTDASAAIARGFAPDVRYHGMPHTGLAAARNAGVAIAGGTFLAHFDSDDLMMPGAITRRMAVFDDDPSLELVVGRVEQFLSPELDDEARARIRVPDAPLVGHLPGAAVLRAETMRRIGPLDTQWAIAADMDWMMRAIDGGVRSRAIPDIVLRRRIHGRNEGMTSQANAGVRLRILKAALDRRRAAGTEPAP